MCSCASWMNSKRNRGLYYHHEYYSRSSLKDCSMFSSVNMDPFWFSVLSALDVPRSKYLHHPYHLEWYSPAFGHRKRPWAVITICAIPSWFVTTILFVTLLDFWYLIMNASIVCFRRWALLYLLFLFFLSLRARNFRTSIRFWWHFDLGISFAVALARFAMVSDNSKDMLFLVVNCSKRSPYAFSPLLLYFPAVFTELWKKIHFLESLFLW